MSLCKVTRHTGGECAGPAPVARHLTTQHARQHLHYWPHRHGGVTSEGVAGASGARRARGAHGARGARKAHKAHGASGARKARRAHRASGARRAHGASGDSGACGGVEPEIVAPISIF